ncbi:MAG TPA: YCF48-related protein [Longimicrobiales bacterium]|nr:YCF48-related protein [Longimicrobiales bacterium]
MTPQSSNTTAGLRGLSVVDEDVAWASGSAGTVLRTTNGGRTWELRSVPQADSLDFRDIEAFDSLSAYVLSAGEDGRIYHTNNGGASWTLQFRNEIKGAFFDCLDFYDRTSGIAMSDPVGNRYLLLTTTNGSAWSMLPEQQRPRANTGEAAFAASGTCLTIAGERAYLASGGGPSARVFVSADRGASWQAVETPVPAHQPSAGIFALAFRDAQNGIAIGGNYQQPQQAATVAITKDGGRSWSAAGTTSYTSGAAWSRSGASLLAVGTPGTRLSRDNALTWSAIDTVEYNAVQFASERVAYAVGPRGRIAQLLRR